MNHWLETGIPQVDSREKILLSHKGTLLTGVFHGSIFEFNHDTLGNISKEIRSFLSLSDQNTKGSIKSSLTLSLAHQCTRSRALEYTPFVLHYQSIFRTGPNAPNLEKLDISSILPILHMKDYGFKRENERHNNALMKDIWQDGKEVSIVDYELIASIKKY